MRPSRSAMRTFRDGDVVRVKDFLDNSRMTVVGHFKNDFYRLAFPNGNIAPGFYHAALMSAV